MVSQDPSSQASVTSLVTGMRIAIGPVAQRVSQGTLSAHVRIPHIRLANCAHSPARSSWCEQTCDASC